VAERIKAVCADMSGIFAPVAREIAPQAKVLHDRFHISKHLNEAVDQVRRKENRRSNIFSVNSVRLTEGCQSFFVDLG
jgi:transposase